LVGMTVVAGLASIAARLGVLHWIGDIFALFIDTYFWLSLAGLIGFVLLRNWRWSTIAGLIFALNASSLIGYLPVNQRVDASSQRDVRLFVYNMYYANDDLDGVLEEIARHDPDVVFLMEYSYAIQREIESRFADYPYRVIEPSQITMGLALFSRIPLGEAQVHRFVETRIPIYQVEMEIADQTVTFVGGHPWPPIGRWGQLHRAQMADITDIAAQSTAPLIVAGDFNASQWSYAVQDLAQAARVADAQRGFGFQKTWFLSPVFGLPLDHVLVSGEWTVLDYSQGEAGGSDHVPLIVDLRLE
ncbi:MAG: endonuclease/exonuclease/phosphatase family protein, partial [Chloroflexota bacterium]